MNEPALDILAEPGLIFRYSQICEDPHEGLNMFGPYDADLPSRPGSVTYAVIGSKEGITAFREFARAIHFPVVAKPFGAPDIVSKDRLLWPPFSGAPTAFSTDWPVEPVWQGAIDSSHLRGAVQHNDAHRRAYLVSDAYLDQIQLAAERDESISVIVCVVPDEVWKSCRPRSVVSGGIGRNPTRKEREVLRKQLPLFAGSYEPKQYELSVDLRRQLKARAMRYGIPLQLVRESTLSLADAPSEPSRRGLTPLSDRAWNLATAWYYKAGGKPWKLAHAREGVCYIGIVFRRSEFDSDPSTACCAAQMFLDTGDGVVFRGEFGPWYSPTNRQFHLDRNAARELLEGVLTTYRAQGGRELKEVFLHSRSWISDEEYRGYRDACPDGVNVVGIRVRRDAGMRMYRRGRWPVARGTVWRFSDRSAYLWTTGFKPGLLTYDGWEVPLPLRIDVQHGDADLEQVCKDVFGLTKLNYNSCRLGDSSPVTIGFSDAVGEILVSNPTVEHRKPNFKFYI